MVSSLSPTVPSQVTKLLLKTLLLAAASMILVSSLSPIVPSLAMWHMIREAASLSLVAKLPLPFVPFMIIRHRTGAVSLFRMRTTSSHVEMRNSIVAGNHAPVEADIAGTLTSDGYNLIQDVSQASLLSGNLASTDLIGMSPEVGPLQNNGGPTSTHALALGSPAMDKVPLKACQIEAIFNSSSKTYTDQRGIKRPQDSACDIGAYEYEVPPH